MLFSSIELVIICVGFYKVIMGQIKTMLWLGVTRKNFKSNNSISISKGWRVVERLAVLVPLLFDREPLIILSTYDIVITPANVEMAVLLEYHASMFYLFLFLLIFVVLVIVREFKRSFGTHGYTNARPVRYYYPLYSIDNCMLLETA
jgi:hypothetical protein